MLGQPRCTAARGGRLAVVGLVLALLLAACGGSSSASSKTHVSVFGDSLLAEATPYLARLSARSDLDLKMKSISGSSTCQWFGTMKKQRDEFHPRIVVVVFSGNALAPCMKIADGNPFNAVAYVAKYRADTERVLDIFGPDVQVYLVGPPASADGTEYIYDLYLEIANEHPNVHFIDGGKLVTPNRTWVATLPCLPHEPCTGPVVNGVKSNEVRAPDRAHFCPKDIQLLLGETCPVYSSGAYRYAVAIFDGITAAHRS